MKKHWSKSIFAILLCLILIQGNLLTVIAGPTNTSPAQAEIAAAVQAGLDYLQTQVNADGGVRWVDESSNMAATLRVVQAIAAAGYTQDLLKSENGQRPIDYLAANAKTWVSQEESENPAFSVARAGQLLTAIAAANENPNRFGPEDLNLIREINLNYDPGAGVYGGSSPENVLDQVWAMIGLAANNAAVPEEAGAWLVSAQAGDGSWNDGFGSTLDTTPLGILALLSTRTLEKESTPIQSALDYMKTNQQATGGWQSEWDLATNANTTAVMLQAIHQLGQSPADQAWKSPEGDPLSALLAVQGADGAFGGEFDNAFSTADALVALAGRSITDLGALEIASDAFAFVFAAQEQNGGWGSVGQTLDVLVALRAAGWQPNTVTTEQASPLDYLNESLEAYLETGPDAIGKAILGLMAAGEDPEAHNGMNLVQRLQAAYDEAAGAFGDPENTWHQALAILGLYAAGEDIPDGAVKTLLSLQQEDGGWEYTPGFGAWPDNTALAIQALLAAGLGPEELAVSTALDYLRATQTDDGGWGDSSSTAFALMAIHALGQSPQDWIGETGKSPAANLLTYQKANGAFVYNWDFPDDNLMSTVTAIMALFKTSYLFDQNVDEMRPLAVIFVDPGEGVHYADCVELKETAVDGMELLERSEFSYDFQEGFLNSIMGIANSEGETNYWSYWSWDGREWIFQNNGAGDSIVFPGSLEAWHFTSWENFPSYPPDFIPDMSQICGEEILRHYHSQPHLDYNDLFKVEMPEVLPPMEGQDGPVSNETAISTETSPEETEESNQPTLSADPSLAPAEDTPQSTLPLLIIAGVGGLVVVLVFVILLKSRK